MKKRGKDKSKIIVICVGIVMVIVIMSLLFNLYKSDEAIAGQVVKVKPSPNYKTNLDFKNVYSCAEVDKGVTIKQTKLSPRESKSDTCKDPMKALKYRCEGRKLGEMKYTSNEVACTGDSWCEGGVCRSCTSGLTRCGRSCLNLQNDFYACGRCDVMCRVAGPNPGERAESCVEGQCVEERKVLLCNIDWLPNDDYGDASPIPESQIDNIFDRVNAHLLADFPERIIKLTYEVYNPQTRGRSGLAVPDYIVEAIDEVVPYCGVDLMKDFDYVVYPFYDTLRFIYDVTEEGDSRFGFYYPQLEDTWGIPITDSNWQEEALYLEDSVITMINEGH